MKCINKYYKTVAEFSKDNNENEEIIKTLLEECSNLSYEEVRKEVAKHHVRNEIEVSNYINYNKSGFVKRTYSTRGYTQVYSTPCGIF